MRKILLVLLIAVLSAVGCQKKEEQQAPYQFPSGQAPTGPIQGIDEAKLLQDEVAKDPKNVTAWIKLGNLQMDSKRFPDAVNAYQKALELDPKNVDVLVDYGSCLRYSGKPDEAVKEYKKALEINPNHLNAHKNLAVVLEYDIKDNAQAIREFEKTLALAPNAPDADKIKQEIQNMKGAK